MDNTRIDHAARLLHDARAGRRKLIALPENARPTTLEEALAVQEAAMRFNQARPGGWKVGAPPGASTTYAPIYESDVYTSPATIACANYPDMLIEGEIAFRLASDLPAARRPYSADQVVDAVEGICVTIEIGESRLADYTGASIPERIADNLGNGALIYGECLRLWRHLDLRQLRVTLEVNGARQIDRTGGKPGDGALDLLVWSANHLNGCDGLRRGHLVTTGSWTGAYAAKPGDAIRIAFDAVGAVDLQCT